MIIFSGPTRFIGTVARNGAVERPLNDSLTRIFKFRAAGGAGGFIIVGLTDLIFCGESRNCDDIKERRLPTFVNGDALVANDVDSRLLVKGVTGAVALH